MLTLGLIETVAFAGVVLFMGYGIRRAVPPLAAFNIPAPVVGGLTIAILASAAHANGRTLFHFDTTLQAPLMIGFFTSVGFGASVSLLRLGGPAVLLFLVFSTVVAAVQNVMGATAAWALGQPPLLGVLAGSVTLTGGPATAVAFAPLFEQAGVSGAATLAVASAMAGIIAGGLIGGPIGTRLVARTPERVLPRPGAPEVPVAQHVAEARLAREESRPPEGEDVEAEAYGLMKALVLILAAMWAGSWLTRIFGALGLTLPAYIGSMLVAAAIRNLDDGTRLIGAPQAAIDDLGQAALSLFLVLALMTLRLWELAGLALPLTAILLLQVGGVAAIAAGPVYRLMGRDYEAAVMASGFCGFMLGTTANAMANMNALVERYGPAPKSFLVVPIVGAFFIDFTNAIVITICLNLWR